MSLTNPDKVITEERLSQFYGSILPYLGGMPEAIANKFSKGDLYSTDEKMIGQWIDGKPLYQKTFSGSSPTKATPFDTGLVNCANAMIVDGYLTTTSNNNYDIGLYLMPTSNGSQLLYHSADTGYTGKPFVCTLQYTKTTDSVISIGSDTDYSATEKIVGTWINGKPIYQKTVDCGALPNATTKNVAHGISNLGDIVNIVGCAISDTSNLYIVLPITSDNDVRSQCSLYVYGSNIVLEARNNNCSAYNRSYVTIQYTKTTD